MNYQQVTPPLHFQFKDPLHLLFRTLSKEQASSYFTWFIEQIPVRIGVLHEVVNSTAGYGDWAPDYSRSSLGSLSTWFRSTITTRRQSASEIEEIYALGPDWFRDVEIGDWDLSKETYSLCYDVGMYFSRILQENKEGLTWKLVTSPPNGVDINQPVLTGGRKLALNPVHVMSVAAFGLADGTESDDVLVRLFRVWLKTI